VFGDLLGFHTVLVQRPTGDSVTGPTYAAPAALVCTVNEQTSVTVSAAGDVTGTVTTIAYDVDLPAMGVGALVELPSGRTGEVISEQESDGPGVFRGLAVRIAVCS
jgi:hypothetical protein